MSYTLLVSDDANFLNFKRKCPAVKISQLLLPKTNFIEHLIFYSA